MLQVASTRSRANRGCADGLVAAKKEMSNAAFWMWAVLGETGMLQSDALPGVRNGVGLVSFTFLYSRHLP